MGGDGVPGGGQVSLLCIMRVVVWEQRAPGRGEQRLLGQASLALIATHSLTSCLWQLWALGGKQPEVLACEGRLGDQSEADRILEKRNTPSCPAMAQYTL